MHLPNKWFEAKKSQQFILRVYFVFSYVRKAQNLRRASFISPPTVRLLLETVLF